MAIVELSIISVIRTDDISECKSCEAMVVLVPPGGDHLSKLVNPLESDWSPNSKSDGLIPAKMLKADENGDFKNSDGKPLFGEHEWVNNIKDLRTIYLGCGLYNVSDPTKAYLVLASKHML